MNWELRAMKPEDWPAVSAIYTEGIEGGRATFQTECPSYESWDRAHLENCRFVCLFAGEVAGFCVLSATSVRAVYRGVAEVSVYVGEKFRGQGAGAALLKTLCEESERAGYWSLYAAIFSINTASVRLHEACGFREIGYREKIAKDKFGHWQNTTIMEKRSPLL